MKLKKKGKLIPVMTGGKLGLISRLPPVFFVFLSEALGLSESIRFFRTYQINHHKMKKRTWREINGVIRTDDWLENDFHPKKICELLLEHFQGEKDSNKIYEYLLSFGMYKHNRNSKKTFESLKADMMWEKTSKIYEKYRRKWNGPAIPIFIFPLDESNARLMREGKGKSGVSFKDKLFLFLTSLDDAKELEALFVHEYHHVCRMNRLNKCPSDYSLLDSMILEGLAENAVAENCGEEYTSDWTRRYSKEKLSFYWNDFISDQLFVQRNDELHDRILFGLGNRPKLIGYAIGYEIVKQYKQCENFTEKTSFHLSAVEFTKNLKF